MPRLSVRFPAERSTLPLPPAGCALEGPEMRLRHVARAARPYPLRGEIGTYEVRVAPSYKDGVFRSALVAGAVSHC